MEERGKQRLRAHDLLKHMKSDSDGQRYDFSKLALLKPKRCEAKTGRPSGIKGRVVQKNAPQRATTETVNLEGDLNVPEKNKKGSKLLSLSLHEVYVNLIKEYDGITPMDDVFTRFILNDFDARRMVLKTGQFVIVSRRAITFKEEDANWVYTCSCDTLNKDLIDSFSSVMEVSFNDFMYRIGYCSHVVVVNYLMEQFDAQHSISPEPNCTCEELGQNVNDSEQFNEMPSGKRLKKLKDGVFEVMGFKKTYILYQSLDGYKCSCSLKRCEHLQLFVDTHEGNMNLDFERPVGSYKCFSKAPIPFHSSEHIQNVYKLSTDLRFPNELNAEEFVCSQCVIPLQNTGRTYNADLFLQNQIIKVTVKSKTCPSCGTEFHFDGLSVCVINMGQKILCHEILRRFMYYFLSGKTTIFTEYQVLVKTYSDAGYRDADQRMSYNDFKNAWYAFLDLLDLDYDSMFMCPKCGPEPETVVMDATSVAFRKELISWKSILSNGQSGGGEYDEVDTGRVKNRTFLPANCRKLLTQYNKHGQGLSEEKVQKLLDLLKSEVNTSVLALIEYIIGQSKQVKGNYVPLDLWREFIKVLASSYPACGFFPPSESFFDFLFHVFQSGPLILSSDVDMATLQTTVPVLFKLISTLRSLFPFEKFLSCLPFFQEKCLNPYSKSKCPSECPTDDDGLSFYPVLERRRRRGTFVCDRKKMREKEDICTKFAKGHPSLLPGVFTMYCPHGVCYGFEVMKLHESPDVPFTLLRTRFQKAPHLVIYDNACTLHSYCLNRDPLFFRGTTFRVDGLHFKNHTACGPGYDLKNYPQFSSLNSQVVEQANSRLQRIKGSLSYMTQDNFLKHCKFYLWGQNESIIKDLKS